MSFKITCDFDGIEESFIKGHFQRKKRLALKVLTDSNFYIPKDTGALESSGRVEGGGKSVSWNTPYAKRLYWNPQFNFSKDANPNARGLWFEEAKQQKIDEWKRMLIRKE